MKVPNNLFITLLPAKQVKLQTIASSDQINQKSSNTVRYNNPASNQWHERIPPSMKDCTGNTYPIGRYRDTE